MDQVSSCFSFCEVHLPAPEFPTVRAYSRPRTMSQSIPTTPDQLERDILVLDVFIRKAVREGNVKEMVDKYMGEFVSF